MKLRPSLSVADRLRAAQAEEIPAPVVSAEPERPANVAGIERLREVLTAPELAAIPRSDQERNRCISNHMFLANEILEMDFQPEHEILFSKFPQRKSGFALDDPYTDRLILWSRGSLKTSAVAVDAVQAILHDPNVRILYVTTDIDLAKRRLTQVADFFDKPTAKFRALFPELCGLERRVAQEFVVKGRSDRTSIDPTFRVSTPQEDNTGSHWDLIFIDDLVTQFNSQSQNMRDITFARYQMIRPLRTGNARMVLTGTTYDPDDTYGRIRKAVAAEGAESEWLVEVRGCWSYKCANCKHKDIFHDANHCLLCETAPCPSFVNDGIKGVLIDRTQTRSRAFIGHTVESLEHERSDAGVGPRNFACQFENNPVPEVEFENIQFTEEFLHTYQADLPRVFFKRAGMIVGDLALTGSQSSTVEAMNSDYYVLYYCEVLDGCAYPTDCVFGRWNAAEAAELIFHFLQKHDFPPTYFEAGGAFDLHKTNIQNFASAIKLDIRAIPVSNVSNAKLVRIGRLYDAILNKKIVLPFSMPGIDFLFDQLKAYPRQLRGHDDFADALSLVQLVLSTNPPAGTTRGMASALDFIHSLRRDEPEEGGGSFSF
jgi:hypothetical protein